MPYSRQHDPLYPAAFDRLNGCSPAFRQRVQAAKVALRVGISIETVRREHGSVVLKEARGVLALEAALATASPRNARVAAAGPSLSEIYDQRVAEAMAKLKAKGVVNV